MDQKALAVADVAWRRADQHADIVFLYHPAEVNGDDALFAAVQSVGQGTGQCARILGGGVQQEQGRVGTGWTEVQSAHRYPQSASQRGGIPRRQQRILREPLREGIEPGLGRDRHPNKALHDVVCIFRADVGLALRDGVRDALLHQVHAFVWELPVWQKAFGKVHQMAERLRRDADAARLRQGASKRLQYRQCLGRG